MRLFVIVGVANDYSTFAAGIALIPSESGEDLWWAVQKVRILYIQMQLLLKPYMLSYA